MGNAIDDAKLAPKVRHKKHEILEKLRAFGIDPEHMLMGGDDRGMHFHDAIVEKFRIRSSEAILDNPYRRRPGPELTHAINAAFGTANFFEEVHRCHDEYDAERALDPRLPPLARETTGYCVSVMLEFNALSHHYHITSTVGTAHCELLREPRPPEGVDLSDGKPAEIADYMVPLKENNPGRLSGGEMGHDRFISEFSAVGKATATMQRKLHLERRTISNKHVPVTGYTVQQASHVPIPDGQSVSLSRMGLGKVQRPSSLRQQIHQATLAIEQKPATGLLAFNEWFEGNDAIVFGKDHGMSPATLGFYFFSSIVSRQLNSWDANKEVLADLSDPALRALSDMAIVSNLLSYTKEDVDTLYRTFRNDAEMQAHLDIHEAGYTRSQAIDSDSNPSLDDLQDIRNTLNNPRPGAFVCCSAGSNKLDDHDSVQQTVEALCRKGYDIYYGGGDKFMMGKVYETVKEWNKRCMDPSDPALRPGQRVNIIGISTRNIAKRETTGGELPDVSLALLTDTIHGRMVNLIGNMSAQIVLNGGAGTVQEIFAFLILQENQDKLVKNKTLTLLNSPTLKDQPRLYDGLLLLYGDGDLKKGEAELKKRGVTLTESVDALTHHISQTPLPILPEQDAARARFLKRIFSEVETEDAQHVGQASADKKSRLDQETAEP